MIKVFGATENINLIEEYQKSEDAQQNAKVEICPEFKPQHPRKLVKHIKKLVSDAIENNQDLDIVTTSEYVLYAVRVKIGQHGTEGQVVTFEEVGDKVVTRLATIQKSGTLNYWAKGVFDTCDDLLDEILDLR